MGVAHCGGSSAWHHSARLTESQARAVLSRQSDQPNGVRASHSGGVGVHTIRAPRHESKAGSHVSAPDQTLKTWHQKGASDATTAFRAVIRGVVNGAEGSRADPSNLCAVTIFGRLASDDLDGVAAALGSVVARANAEEWRFAAADAPAGFIDAYTEGFLDGFLASSVAFRAGDATVGDYLAKGSPADEVRWLSAMSQVWVAEVGQPGRSHAQGPARLVIFQYCVSLGLVSFKRSSGVKVIPAGGSVFLAGLPYTLISLMVGWWGIPWGPIWTLETIGRNLAGGIDVTDAAARLGGPGGVEAPLGSGA